MPAARRPVLYEINVRVWLRELAGIRERPLSLARVPDVELDRVAGLGIDFVWLMGVWPSGQRGIATALAAGQAWYREALPDFEPADVTGSPYSIADYVVDPELGGPDALARFRERLAERDVGLVLDFVPNHTGVDHPWVRERPDLYVPGRPDESRHGPPNFFEVETVRGREVLAHGRDPYFPAWTDTAQLDLRQQRTHAALCEVLAQIAGQCDGVRCDMAMLALGDVFERTWAGRPRAAPEDRAEGELWTEAIGRVRSEHPEFLFIAEAYWDLDDPLRRLGFDATYDKTLYDHLVNDGAPEVRAHLARHDGAWQGRYVRFLENHDEPRAAAALPWERHRAAAVVIATTPGWLLLHEGQLEGRRVKLPVQLRRRPSEPDDDEVRDLYRRLLATLRDPVLRRGRWRLLDARPAWEGNPTWEHFIVYAWRLEAEIRLIAVNFSPTAGQCRVDLGWKEPAARAVEFQDLLGSARYRRDGAELAREGLYLDMPAFAYHLFEVRPERTT